MACTGTLCTVLGMSLCQCSVGDTAIGGDPGRHHCPWVPQLPLLLLLALSLFQLPQK